MAANTRDHVDRLVQLCSDFLDGRLSAAQFDDTYRHAFSTLPPGVGRQVFGVLEELAFACEDYVEDPAIREAGDLDDVGLRIAVESQLTRLAGDPPT